MSASIIDRVLTAKNLPSLPAVALRVLDLTEREDASAALIAGAIEKDPALTARILKTANSSLFGLAKSVATVHQATVVLGLRTVKVMALSFSLIDTLGKGQSGLFDLERYWRRSLSTAVMAKLIAESTRFARPDEVFVAGILCDIGVMAASRVAPDVYGPIHRKCAQQVCPLQDVERETFDSTHAQISAGMLRSWNLPDTLSAAVAAHHGEGLAEADSAFRDLANILYAANVIAELFCGDRPSSALDEMTERCAEAVGLRPAALGELMHGLDARLKETAELFSVNIGESISYQELRDRAVMQLAAISVTAEREREQASHQAQEVRSQLEQLSHRAEDLERQASVDALTQIANRARFEQRLADAVATAQSLQGCVGLILMDLDHFKKLNDTFGHQAGDEALRQVGRVLQGVSDDVRLAARYGGEEFAVVVGDVTARDLRELAEEIRAGIERIRFDHNGNRIALTASLGAAHVSYEYEVASAKEIVERADECLYDAKRAGRNRVEITF